MTRIALLLVLLVAGCAPATVRPSVTLCDMPAPALAVQASGSSIPISWRSVEQSVCLEGALNIATY